MSEVSFYPLAYDPSRSRNEELTLLSSLLFKQTTNATGGGLASSPVVAGLSKTTGGEGLTRAELAEKKAAEVEAKKSEKKSE